MVFDLPDTTIFWILGGLSILVILKELLRAPARAEAYLKYLWIYFLIFTTVGITLSADFLINGSMIL